MKINVSTFKKAINPIIFGLIIFEICIPIIYLTSILITGRPDHLFDMNSDFTITSLLQALLLFFTGTITLILLIYSKERPSRGFKIIMVLCFYYATIDEIFKIHLRFKNWFPDMNTRYWIGGYLGIIFILPVVFYRDIMNLWNNHRKETIFAISGAIIFVIGGFGLEILKDYILQPILLMLFQNNHKFLPLMLEKIRISLEEYGEMLGETLIFYGFLRFGVKKLEKHEGVEIN
ncbi:MAG TPA: hypothetical protein V6C58_21145 [Allocoleopsis sp.]